MYSLGDFLEEGWSQLIDFKDFLGPDNIFLSLIIIGFFFLLTKVLIKWSLFQDKYGEPNMSSAGGMALIISFAVAWFVNYSGAVESVHAGNIFDYLGYSSGPGETIIPLLVLGVFIYIIFKIGPWFLIIGGAGLFVASFTDLIYSTGAGIFTGFVLALIGGLWLWRKWKKKQGGENKNNLSFLAILSAIGLILAYVIASVVSFYIAIIFFIIYFISVIILWLKRRAKWIASKYDWEKEKRQAKAIGKRFLWGGKKVAGAGKWVGSKTKQGWNSAKNRREQQTEERERAYKEAQEKLKEEKKIKRDKYESKEVKAWKNELKKVESELSRLSHSPSNSPYIKKLKKKKDKILKILKSYS